MTIVLKAKYRFNAIPITNGIFHRIRRKNFTIYMEIQKTPKSQSNLKRNRAEEIRLPDFKLYDTAPVIKTVWY